MKSLLDATQIISCLQYSGMDVEVVSQTQSTNSDLMGRTPYLKKPVARIAWEQTAGRGRMDRKWIAQPGHSLTFSLAWLFPHSPHFLVGLSLMTGVVLACTLNDLGLDIRLKWPNDLLREGKKLGGVLIETAPAHADCAPGKTWGIIGVGINLQLPDQIEESIRKQAAQAPELLDKDRNKLIARLLDALSQGMMQFSKEGIASCTTAWNALHEYAGQQVSVLGVHQQALTGTAVGINEYGQLIIENDQGTTALFSGDVSLRVDSAYE